MKAESWAIQEIAFHNFYNPIISKSISIQFITPIYISYIIYTYNNIVCVLIRSLVFVVLIFYCAKTFSFILIIVVIVDERNYESLLEFYTTCLMVACLPLARVKILQKIWGLARNIYRIGIVTKYNLLFDIMTLTFCNNHCQHLFIWFVNIETYTLSYYI